jgi:hypothetical protein
VTGHFGQNIAQNYPKIAQIGALQNTNGFFKGIMGKMF